MASYHERYLAACRREPFTPASLPDSAPHGPRFWLFYPILPGFGGSPGPLFRRQAQLSYGQAMQALQIVGQADQTPFPRHLPQPAQRELAEAHGLFDDADHRFHRAFAQAIDRPPRR